MEEIIIQLDRRLSEIRRRVIEAKGQPSSTNNCFEDILKITHQHTSMTRTEKKGITDKELKGDVCSQTSEFIHDFDVRDLETKTNMKLMELQASQGSKAGLDHTEEKSLRISEIRRDYVRSSYTKTDKQKGLGIIIYEGYSLYHTDPDTTHLQEFFEEIGFVVKCTEKSDWRHLLQYMSDATFYCVFIVFKGYWPRDYKDDYLIKNLLSQRDIGKPVIIMTDFRHPFYFIDEDNENNDILIVQPTMQTSIGPYRHPGYKNIFDMFDDFMKVTRSNRFADVIDILTRINSLYDYPLITFLSTLRKKLCFV